MIETRSPAYSRPGVLITFDVECSMGGAWGDTRLRPVSPSHAVWGERAGGWLGLPLIVEILSRYGLRGTFFVTPFIEEQGYPGEAERICDYLLNHGQDVQLHVHPNHVHYGLARAGKPHPRTDIMADLSPQDQHAMLQAGKERIERWTGRPVAAFRAGNMGASEETLRQLGAVGIPIDSSYTFPYVGGHCRFAPQHPYNGTKWYDGVLEVALSAFRQLPLPGLHPGKPLDLVGISFAECREAIRRICGAGAEAVVILHSFSLFKWRGKQYDAIRPNGIVRRRFEHLCRWLAATGQYPVRTFHELAGALSQGGYRPHHVPPCLLAHPRSLIRKAVQAWNRFHWT